MTLINFKNKLGVAANPQFSVMPGHILNGVSSLHFALLCLFDFSFYVTYWPPNTEDGDAPHGGVSMKFDGTMHWVDYVFYVF